MNNKGRRGSGKMVSYIPVWMVSRVLRRFLKKTKPGKNGCRVWTGPIFKKTGYGDASVLGYRMMAHRMAYSLLVGRIPFGKKILHSCNVKLCTEPDHLRPGTQLENMRQMVIQGRSAKGDRSTARLHIDKMPRGESHGMSKLTEKSVIAIRNLWSTGKFTKRDLARKFLINRRNIYFIVNGKAWKHVGDQKIAGRGLR